MRPYSPRLARSAEGRSRKSADAAAEVRGEKALQQTAANHWERGPLATTLAPGRALRSALLHMAIRVTAKGIGYRARVVVQQALAVLRELESFT